MNETDPLEFTAEEFIDFISGLGRREIASLISSLLEHTIDDLTSDDEDIRYRGEETLAFVNGYISCHKKHTNPTSLMLSGHMLGASEQFYRNEDLENE